jgi:hypothetical protein
VACREIQQATPPNEPCSLLDLPLCRRRMCAMRYLVASGHRSLPGAACVPAQPLAQPGCLPCRQVSPPPAEPCPPQQAGSTTSEVWRHHHQQLEQLWPTQMTAAGSITWTEDGQFGAGSACHVSEICTHLPLALAQACMRATRGSAAGSEAGCQGASASGDTHILLCSP